MDRFKATPHRDCRPIASPNFSSDCTKSTNKAGAYEEILGKNDGKFASKRAAKPVGRSLCGVALNSRGELILEYYTKSGGEVFKIPERTRLDQICNESLTLHCVYYSNYRKG